MTTRLTKELLSEDGVFWLHCDTSRGHYLKCILDEIFGNEYFVNQVVWKRSDAHSDVGQGARHLGAIHDMLLVYTKGSDYIWNDIFYKNQVYSIIIYPEFWRE